MMMHTMDHAGGGLHMGVLPFDGMGLYEQPRPRLVFKMPRVVPDQKNKFENDELFRRLSRESEVKYTGYRDRPIEERQMRFQNGCREGHTEIAFAATGTNLQLVFGVATGNFTTGPRECDFDKEHGKVHLKSHLIMNGVCVTWRGWIDLERLDGVGCLEFDEERATEEDAILRDQLERYNRRMHDMEEKHRVFRSGAGAGAGVGVGVGVQPPTHLNHHHHHQHHAAVAAAAAHHQAAAIAHHQHLNMAAANAGLENHLNHRQDPEMELRLRAF
ncbi:protein big brother-like [Trichogramma pretiosum]|uniref:protein big brother-like n=1 Tax=Trichogramma pretiosum TaxID=7493 RepID=UPI0006C9B532|nr:protein big brother-like [Trichogramma pretiosum]